MPPLKRAASNSVTVGNPSKVIRHGQRNDAVTASSQSTPLHTILPSSLGFSSQPDQEFLRDTNGDVVDGDASEARPLEFYGTMDNKIVGVRYYNGIVTPGESILFYREPSNPFDSNAVRVDNIMGNQIGHLPRILVQKLA